MKRAYVPILVALLMTMLAGCAHNSVQTVGAGDSLSVLERITAKGELVVGTAGSMPPFNMTTRDGEIIGLDVDLAKYLADGMGVTLKLKVMPFAELLPALESGTVDMIISAMTITPERNLKFSFVGPYFVSGKAFLTKKEKIASAQQVSEINRPDITLAALHGSTSQFFAQEAIPKAKLVTTQDYDLAVDMVINNKVDAFIADFPICLVSLMRYPQKGLYSLLTPFTYEPFGIAMPAGDPTPVNWVENFLNAMEESGALDDLKAHWFEDNQWLARLPR